MTKKEINASWSQAKTSNVHNKFGQEMAKRTVINRAAKNIINTSDDSDLLIQAVNKSTEDEYVEEGDRRDVTEEETADNLLTDFKAVISEEKTEETQEYTQEKTDKLNGHEQENKSNAEEVEYLDFEEVEETEENDTPKEIDWSKWSDDEIKETLDNKKIVYQKDAKRDELIAVAEMAINGGVIQNELL